MSDAGDRYLLKNDVMELRQDGSDEVGFQEHVLLIMALTGRRHLKRTLKRRIVDECTGSPPMGMRARARQAHVRAQKACHGEAGLQQYDYNTHAYAWEETPIRTGI